MGVVPCCKEWVSKASLSKTIFDSTWLILYFSQADLCHLPRSFSTFYPSQLLLMPYMIVQGGSDGKASAYNSGDPGSIRRSGRSPGEGNGNPLQYSCQESPMEGEAWLVKVHVVAKSQTRLSNFTFFSFYMLYMYTIYIIYLLNCTSCPWGASQMVQ